MNDYAILEFILGTLLVLIGVFFISLGQPPVNFMIGIPLIVVSGLAFYLGYLCLDK